MFPPWPERDQGRSEAQGITAANPAELDELVRIGTWSESCYAFAHYTDDELADGIMCRRRWPTGEDINRVWRSGRWDE